MLTSIKQRLDREDEGFTLIELMVVLLIIAILLAIAIPTFLGARDTANARGSQENLRNALTAEQTYWTNNQTFTTDASSIEAALTWETGAPTKGANDVYAITYNYGTAAAVSSGSGATTPNASSDSVVLEAYAKDGNCYAIYATNNGTTSFTAYDEVAGACSTSLAQPTAKPTQANASQTLGTWSLNF